MAPPSGKQDGVEATKEVVTILRSPGKRLFQIAFRADVATGPVIKVWELLDKHEVRIIRSNLTNVKKSSGDWSVFVESDNYGITAEGLRRILEELDFLEDLRVAGGGETIVDELHFPLVDSTGERTMLISQHAFQSMVSAMSETFGTGGMVISYQEGFALGARVLGELRGIVGGDLQHFVSQAVKLYDASGIGRADFIEADYDAYRFAIRMYHNIECEGKRTEKPNSEWIRGHICGAASTALQVPMQCTETKCIAVGDPYCLFVLRKVEV